MTKLAFGALLVGLLVACGGDGNNNKIKLPDASGVDGPSACNPLTQAGCAANEKCTWMVDAVMPQYVGHVGCAMDGTKNVGEACTYGPAGATGFDDCKKGAVCSQYAMPGQAGTCKQVCDQQGGMPMCDAQHVCVTYSRLFSTGESTPAAAGVCDLACDPLQDNDFDGSNGTLLGPAAAKRGQTCGAAANMGCYGYPSFGTPPASGWSCTGDINSAAPGVGLRHRVQCTEANDCADAGPTIYVNSCNQGYLPLLRESSLVSTAVCIALCKPSTCYNGACGTNNVDRQGATADGCRSTERAGSFFAGGATNGGATGGEHCTHLWYFERDDMGNVLKSPTSDSVGFCYDHDKYQYDSNANGMVDDADLKYPNCGMLGSASSTATDPTMPLLYWGATDLGCMTTASIPMAANGKISPTMLEKQRQLDIPRALYRRQMAPPAPIH